MSWFKKEDLSWKVTFSRAVEVTRKGERDTVVLFIEQNDAGDEVGWCEWFDDGVYRDGASVYYIRAICREQGAPR